MNYYILSYMSLIHPGVACIELIRFNNLSVYYI
jgi:hypothetical protein